MPRKIKPTLVQVGENLVSPDDVAAIKKIKSIKNLYIIVLRSQPNPEFPFWATGTEVADLIKHFNIIASDS